jgi:hypothetical protein
MTNDQADQVMEKIQEDLYMNLVMALIEQGAPADTPIAGLDITLGELTEGLF